MFPPIHPRVFICQKAAEEIDTAIMRIQREYNLTSSELFMILSQNMSFTATLFVRTERQGERVEPEVESPGSTSEVEESGVEGAGSLDGFIQRSQVEEPDFWIREDSPKQE